MPRRIEIVEVGPRDGLQNEAQALEPNERAALVRRLEAAGVRRIEAVSFVNPRRVPQMADAEAVMAALPPAPGRSRIGLVLNRRGWDRCLATGCDEANVVVCATDGFGVRNQGSTTADQLLVAQEVAALAAAAAVPVSATISVAFGCPFDGEVAVDRIAGLARDLAAAGIAEVALGDTIGVADPWRVRRTVEAVAQAAPDVRLRLHFHDTRRAGLANAFAGVEAGVSVLDGSVGGIGGCPFAPGATGNVATEDLGYMLQRAGFETGLDLEALAAIARDVAARLGKARPPGGLANAGLFPPPARDEALSAASCGR